MKVTYPVLALIMHWITRELHFGVTSTNNEEILKTSSIISILKMANTLDWQYVSLSRKRFSPQSAIGPAVHGEWMGWGGELPALECPISFTRFGSQLPLILSEFKVHLERIRTPKTFDKTGRQHRLAEHVAASGIFWWQYALLGCMYAGTLAIKTFLELNSHTP